MTERTDREELLREAHRLVNERMRAAAAKVRAKLGPTPRELETGRDPFEDDIPLVIAPRSRPL